MSDTESTAKVDKQSKPNPPKSPESPGSAKSGAPTRPVTTPDSNGGTTGGQSAGKPRIGDTRPAPAGPRPQIGDTRPAPAPAAGGSSGGTGGSSGSSSSKKRRRRRGKGGSGSQPQQSQAKDARPKDPQSKDSQDKDRQRDGSAGKGSPRSKSGSARRGSAKGGSSRSRGGQRQKSVEPVEMVLSEDDAVELDESQLKKRSGRSRKGRPLGRYQMNVHVGPDSTQIAILEGRALIEHYVSRPSDDITQIHGNIYVGRVENVLPGMEAAFIDIATPKNAVLYRGDVQYDPEDVLESGESPRIEDVLKPKQLIVCQVTKNPIAHKGARLTQEVSLAGRFVVLVPNSKTYGISKRLPDVERKRLRKLLDRIKPAEHGIIVRTAAAGVTTEEVERDVMRLIEQWSRIEELASKQTRPGLIYREPELAVRFIREEFNSDYRAVMIDDKDLYTDVLEYVEAVAPALTDRITYYDRSKESLSLFDRFHITEQLTKTLDRKVWLPSGGSLIIEATEALTVIDVNTGRNVGSSSLEETVFKNNLEAADEIARQLRLRDIGGIIVIDFIDMEVKENRDAVVKRFREALSRDKTRTQVFNISELGLVEMTRKRIGEGLLETVATVCDKCDGVGLIIPPEFTTSS